jgi:NAD(P)H dehydrogenase (quinone)
MRVAITGASGQLGGLAAEIVLGRLAGDDVVLVSRTPEALRSFGKPGVQLRRGDFDDARSLAEAFAGVDRVLLISTTSAYTGRRVAQHRRAIEAAIGCGVSHVVFTSMPNTRPGHPSGTYAQEYRLTEEFLATTGIGWSTLRNSPYAENLLPRLLRAVATGRLTSNAASGRAAYISRADCAAVAAAVLLGPDDASTEYEITGPELLSQADVAALVSEVAGRQIALVDLDDADFLRDLADSGLPEARQQSLAAHLAAVREGYFDVSSRTAAKLIGRPPRTLREVLHGHRQELASALRG